MDKSRTDRLGRQLLCGEDQMPDGRYRYRFIDPSGKRVALYSWRLLPEDPLPPGRRKSESIREKRQHIENNPGGLVLPEDRTSPSLNELFQRYMKTKPELKPSSRENYTYLYEGYIEPNLGNRPVTSVRYSDLRAFYISMVTSGVTMRDRRTGELRPSRPFKVSSMGMIQGILHPIFTMAVKDGYLSMNPCDGMLKEIRRAMRQPKSRRHALTEEQQERFVDFISKSGRYRGWLPLLTTFLGTGCRVGELLGLRWEDCDLKKGVISVNHSIIYRKLGNTSCRMHISTPKTPAGCRTIPMLSAVKEALLKEKERQKREGNCISIIDGYHGFVFMNRNRTVHNPSDLNRALERMRLLYNKEEERTAAEEDRPPVLIPHFSAHNLRHTFCTRFCENETNIKMIQDIMGHADISTTMNIYAEATEEKKQQTMKNLEGKIRIS